MNIISTLTDIIQLQLQSLLLIDDGKIANKEEHQSDLITPNTGFNTPLWTLQRRPVHSNYLKDSKIIPACLLSFEEDYHLTDADLNRLGVKVSVGKEAFLYEFDIQLVCSEGFGPAEEPHTNDFPFKNPSTEKVMAKELTDQVSGFNSDLMRLLTIEAVQSSHLYSQFRKDNISILRTFLNRGLRSGIKGSKNELYIVNYQVIVSFKFGVDPYKVPNDATLIV